MVLLTAILLLASLTVSTGFNFHNREVPQTERTCERLADAILDGSEGTVLGVKAETGFDLRYIVQWATTVDIDDRHQVRDVICNVVGVDVDQVVNYLDSTGILEQFIRRAYDLDVAMVQQMKPMLQIASQHEGVISGVDQTTSRIQLQIFALAERTGFLNLDPQGVAESQGYLAMVSILALGAGPGGPNRRSTTRYKRETHCEEAKLLLGKLLASNDSKITGFMQMVGIVTGLSAQGADAYGQAFCDVLLSSSIRGIVDVLRDYRVITHSLQFALEELRPKLQEAHTTFQSIASMDLSSIMGPRQEAMLKEEAAQKLGILTLLRELGIF
ncbi:hypothetical protein CAPTEDRAFT_216053 [Capitella teleta]|uniref:Uncharacterized protein n=1 Tax=Capitella teleta TaxID=283909 RepID=R7TYK9_CAPTE|nr:hypothetical protein CAPTEDRAFT_216053 [Capitella teleta]|eukprot:ELT96516.1 hypothetical protein CAPTEDRAFT_216053 [Capitella teleta]